LIDNYLIDLLVNQLNFESTYNNFQKCKAGAGLGGKRSVLYTKDMNQQKRSFDALNDSHDKSLHDHHVVEGPIEEASVYEEADTDLTTCLKCCNDSNYCNQNLCDNTLQRMYYILVYHRCWFDSRNKL
jgi:hypothetical protein